MIENAIDFERLRSMRCGSCQDSWQVDAEWLDRFDRGLEACPSCRTDCQSTDRPNFWVAQDDPAHDDDTVRGSYWYHSSTSAHWPDKLFDPAAQLTDDTKQLMGGADAVERWVLRQKTKALHIGTYAAAIENMFRRMGSQGDSTKQFYLYRVRLSADSVIEPGVHKEPTNFMGDAQLADVCSPGANVYRYVNTHEDPSSVTLAVGIDAIHSVQRVALPLPVSPDDSWVHEAVSRLREAAVRPAPIPKNIIEPMKRRISSALRIEASSIEAESSADIPLAIRRRFHVGFDEVSFDADPGGFPAKVLGLARLITNAQSVIEMLNSKPWRQI